MTSTLAFSTSTDGTTINNLQGDPELFPVQIPDPHCFVCHRHTDHFGEHDSLVLIGLAAYDYSDGSVLVTELARTKLGMRMRDVYDAAITRSMHMRGVCLIKPEGEVLTFLGTMDTAG